MDAGDVVRDKIRLILKKAPRDVVYANGRFENEQITLLSALWAETAESLRPRFTGSLLGFANGPNIAVVVHTAVELGFLAPLLDLIQSTSTPALVNGALGALASKIQNEPQRFPSADADLVAASTSDLVIARIHVQLQASILGDALDHLRYLQLAEHLLQRYNPEINTDRTELLSRMERLGFAGDVARALEEIDRQVYVAVSEFDYKGCMDLIRVALELFLKQSCSRVEHRAGKPAPSNEDAPQTSHFGSRNQYLRSCGVTSVDEHRVLGTLYGYLSNEGTHALGSEREQVRVSRNTAIEWMLLVSGRVQAFVSEA